VGDGDGLDEALPPEGPDDLLLPEVKVRPTAEDQNGAAEKGRMEAAPQIR
jgi:hypothetical protein